MLNFTTTSILIIGTLITITNATGSIEVIFASPNNSYVSTTICASTICNGFDSTASKKLLLANVPLRIEDGQFNGFAPAEYEFQLEIFNKRKDRIGSVSQLVDTNTGWKTGIVRTTAGFNVSYQFRTLCDDHYFGPQCRKYCPSLSDIECTKTASLDICESDQPCQNGGECINDLKFGVGYQCKCPQGFVGQKCEKPVVKCPTCYTGENCEQLDVKCLKKHIKNGSKAKKTHQVDDKPSNDDKMMWMMSVLIFCVLLLTIVVIIGRRETVTKVEIVNTPTKSYKVYVIETSSPSKQGQHDPPPAYSPSPSSHKSLQSSKSPDQPFFHPGPAMIV